MKIPDQYVKELVQNISGDRGVDIIFLIKDKENVSEFKIAEKLHVTVNEVRNSLYKLQDKNLVFFTRKKDKKKGWYIYFWNFDKIKAYDLLVEMKHAKKIQLQQVLQQEKQGSMYVCPNKCVRVKSEEALEYQFKCPECDAVLIEENLDKRTEKIKKELERLHTEMEELSKIEKPIPKPFIPKKGAKKKVQQKKPFKKFIKPKHHKKQVQKHKHAPPQHKKQVHRPVKKQIHKPTHHREVKKHQPKKEVPKKEIPQPQRHIVNPSPVKAPEVENKPPQEEKKGFFGRIKSKFGNKR